MKRQAAGVEASSSRRRQQLDRHVAAAAELARQRPVGAGAIDQDAAEHGSARGGRRELVELGLAVEGEQPDAAPIGIGDVALLLDGVAVGDARRLDAGGEAEIDLARARDVEIGAEARQPLDQLGRRVGLDGIEDAGDRQRLGQLAVIVLDAVEVDDQARGVGVLVGEESEDTLGHGKSPVPHDAGAEFE